MKRLVWLLAAFTLACGGGPTPTAEPEPPPPELTLGYDQTAIEVVGWSDDGSEVALRRWLTRSDGGEPCPGYLDADGEPFVGGLELWLCGRRCSKMPIQSASECTPPDKAQDALARAKQQLSRAGIRKQEVGLTNHWRLQGQDLVATAALGEPDGKPRGGAQAHDVIVSVSSKGTPFTAKVAAVLPVPLQREPVVSVPMAAEGPTGRTLAPVVEVRVDGFSAAVPAPVVGLNENDALSVVSPSGALDGNHWGSTSEVKRVLWGDKGVLLELADEPIDEDLRCALDGPLWVMVRPDLAISDYTRPVGPDCTESESAMRFVTGPEVFKGFPLEQPLLDPEVLGALVTHDTFTVPGRAPLPRSHIQSSEMHEESWSIGTVSLSPEGDRALVLGSWSGSAINGDAGDGPWLVALLERDGDGWRLLREGQRPSGLENPWPLP